MVHNLIFLTFEVIFGPARVHSLVSITYLRDFSHRDSQTDIQCEDSSGILLSPLHSLNYMPLPTK